MEEMKRLSVKGLAIALGATWSLGVLMAGVVAIFGWCDQFVEVMGSIYLGYDATFIGAVIGAIWAFFDGAIGGALIAFIYNKVAGRRRTLR